MSKKSVESARSGLELIDAAERQGAVTLRQTGSHAMLKLPNGDLAVVPAHAQELGKGLRLKLVKAMLAAGLTVLLVGLFIQNVRLL